jgi:hypothetical protein
MLAAPDATGPRAGPLHLVSSTAVHTCCNFRSPLLQFLLFSPAAILSNAQEEVQRQRQDQQAQQQQGGKGGAAADGSAPAPPLAPATPDRNPNLPLLEGEGLKGLRAVVGVRDDGRIDTADCFGLQSTPGRRPTPSHPTPPHPHPQLHTHLRAPEEEPPCRRRAPARERGPLHQPQVRWAREGCAPAPARARAAALGRAEPMTCGPHMAVAAAWHGGCQSADFIGLPLRGLLTIGVYTTPPPARPQLQPQLPRPNGPKRLLQVSLGAHCGSGPPAPPERRPPFHALCERMHAMLPPERLA